MTPHMISARNKTISSDMNDFFKWITEIFITIGFFIWSFIQALCRSFTPVSWQHKVKLKGKVVLITGAGGGIGSELAKSFAGEGARLILWDNNEKFLTTVIDSCKELGAEVIGNVVDITDREKVYKLAEKICAEFGSVDILINNAGILNPQNFFDLNDKNIDTLMEVNIKALFWTTKAFLPEMLKRKMGHLVCTSSVGGFIGCPGLVDYSASKFATIGFMEALQHELLNEGHTSIKFTTVCPIFVKTPLIEEFHIFDSKLPVLRPETVAKKIIEAIKIEQQILIIPRDLYWLNAFKGILPTNLYQYLVLHRRFSYG